MWVYLVFLLLLSLQIWFLKDRCFAYNVGPRKRTVFSGTDKQIAIIICAELIIFTGLRAPSIGADTAVYVDALEHYRNLSFTEIFTAPLVWPDDFEIGYFIFTKICSVFGCSPTVFLFLIAIFTYIPYYRYIVKYSKSLLFSTLTYFAFGFFSYSMGIFRQMIAIGIVYLGLEYVVNRKFLKYLLLVFAASLIHATAWIMLPLYFLVKFDWRKKISIIIVFILEGVVFVFGSLLINLAVKLLPQYAHYLEGEFGAKGGSYLNLILLNAVLIVYLLMTWQNKDTDDDKYSNLFITQLICAIMLQVCGYHMSLFGRIVAYYSISLTIILPEIIALSPCIKLKKRFTAIIVAALLCLLAVNEFANNSYLLPFSFFWQ